MNKQEDEMSRLRDENAKLREALTQIRDTTTFVIDRVRSHEEICVHNIATKALEGGE
jgi:hypothetical protein